MAGEIDDIKGRVKKAVGELTDDDKLKQEGTVDKVAGKVKDVVDKAADKAKDVLKKD
ncbi:MAG: CsbD family protein [Actinobacteria bacterium]|nr:CsbD family protein [Actinomycetota bacterium]